MKIHLSLVFASLVPFVVEGQVTSAVESLPFRSRVEIKSSDGKRVISFAPPKDRSIADTWSLTPANITTELTDAYRYGDRIIAFGWSGNFNGVVTIIDAKSGREQMELLVNERSRFITPSGALVYKRWFVKEAFEPDDSIWMLDLTHPLPRPSSVIGNVADLVGTRIYSTDQDGRVRHRFSNLVSLGKGQDLFLADRPIAASGSPQVCFVRISVSAVNQATNKRNCMNEGVLVGYLPSAIQSTSLIVSSTNDLIYTVAGGDAGKTEDFSIDPVTLIPANETPRSPAQDGETGRGPPPLRVPWDVQKAILTAVKKVDLSDRAFAGHEQDHVTARLLISETGTVLQATVSGSTDELRKRLEGTLVSWAFKPTILNGQPTKVLVQFEATVVDLSDIR